MNIVQGIVANINAIIDRNLSIGGKAKLLGIAELLEKDGKVIPVVKIGSAGEPALPNTGYDFWLYHRIIEGPITETVDGYGDGNYQRFEIRLRIFGYAKASIFTDCWTSQDAAMRVMDAMPVRVEMPTAGARRVTFSKVGRVQVDGDVWRTERPDADQGRANPLALAAFSIEYELTGELCNGFCLDGEAVTLPSICSPVTVTDTTGEEVSIPSGGTFTCTTQETIITRRFDFSPSSNGYEAAYANFQEGGTIDSITYGSHLSSVLIYINDSLASAGAAYSVGDRLRIDVVRSSNGNTHVSIGCKPTSTQTVATSVPAWEWARWMNLSNMSVEDSRFVGCPYSLKTTGLGGYSPYSANKNAQSIQRITWADDFTIEFGDCHLPQDLFVGISDSDNVNEGVNNILHALSMDTAGQNVRVRQSGAFTYSAYFTSLNQTVGGDVYTVLEASTLWRIVKSHNTISYQVKPRGDAGSASWATIYSATHTYASSKEFRVEVNMRYTQNYWNGVRLIGNWIG